MTSQLAEQYHEDYAQEVSDDGKTYAVTTIQQRYAEALLDRAGLSNMRACYPILTNLVCAAL
jgi:hypothetical protein